MNVMSKPLVAALLCSASSALFAQIAAPTAINTCPPGYLPAVVDIQATVSTAAQCPLLQDRELRKLVDRTATGYTFAYPAVPGSCMSGSVTSGTITLPNQAPIPVSGRTESAQRFLPEAAALYGPAALPLFINGGSFVSGAAMTVVSLRQSNSKLTLNLVLDDRFTINYAAGAPFPDTEDLLVVGSSGNFSVTGRLTGTAQIIPNTDGSVAPSPFSVAGMLCMK